MSVCRTCLATNGEHTQTELFRFWSSESFYVHVSSSAALFPKSTGIRRLFQHFAVHGLPNLSGNRKRSPIQKKIFSFHARSETSGFYCAEKYDAPKLFYWSITHKSRSLFLIKTAAIQTVLIYIYYNHNLFKQRKSISSEYFVVIYVKQCNLRKLHDFWSDKSSKAIKTRL